MTWEIKAVSFRDKKKNLWLAFNQQHLTADGQFNLPGPGPVNVSAFRGSLPV